MSIKRSSSVTPTIAALSMILFIQGCTFVSLQPDAVAVARIEEPAASACEELGTTRVQVLDKLGFFSRNPATVSDELDTLARNAAVEMGGNAVAPSGSVEAGKRTYRVLRCP